jgi:hypothetical protein
MVQSRSAIFGPAARPVSIPEGIERRNDKLERGTVVLPMHVRWSGPPIEYDLTNPADRARVYEQVLREGIDDDVRRFIDPDELMALWDNLVLPVNVRRAWALWFRRNRGADLAC